MTRGEARSRLIHRLDHNNRGNAKTRHVMDGIDLSRLEERKHVSCHSRAYSLLQRFPREYWPMIVESIKRLELSILQDPEFLQQLHDEFLRRDMIEYARCNGRVQHGAAASESA